MLNDGSGERMLLLFFRRDMDVEFQTLDHCEYAFLHAIYKHSNFFTACDAATKEDPEYNIGKLLLKHIQTNTLIDLEFQI